MFATLPKTSSNTITLGLGKVETLPNTHLNANEANVVSNPDPDLSFFFYYVLL